MTAMNQSWLYRNDTRKYPLVDTAVGGTTGLVDLGISVPEGVIPEGARVFVRDLMVSEVTAAVILAYEGPMGPVVLAEARVAEPRAYRLYPLGGVIPGVFGHVIFGSSCYGDRQVIVETHTPDTGALVASVISRYPVPPASGFRVGDTEITGAAVFQGSGGVVAEVIPVYFAAEGITARALVLRLERNLDVMTAPVSPCDTPAEVANREDLVTSINEVYPDADGVIYLDFLSKYDFKYVDPTPLLDANGNPVIGTDGSLIYDPQTGPVWFSADEAP